MMCFKVLSYFYLHYYALSLRHLGLSDIQTSSSFFLWSIYGTGNCILKWCVSMDPEMWETTTVGEKNVLSQAEAVGSL